MSTNLSPNMQLPVPAVGSESGPLYAQDVNNCFALVDAHTHLPGSGVPITPGAININTFLNFNNNLATALAGLTLTAQSVTPAVNTIYESGLDLYFVDGVGNNVRITQSGGVAGSPGSISNLTSPASAAYVAMSSTFVWQSNTSIAANMDFGSAIFRNLSPNSTFGLTLQAPAALASNYSITLPALPASQKIMTLDSSGILAAPYTVDNSTIEIATNIIQVKAGGIGTTQLANSSVTPAKQTTNRIVSSSSGAFTTTSASLVDVTNLSCSITSVGKEVYITAIPDGSGGGNISDMAAQYSAVGTEGVAGMQWAVIRDSTEIARGEFFGYVKAGVVTSVPCPLSAITVQDAPGAGTFTYKIQVRQTAQIAKVNFAILVVEEP